MADPPTKIELNRAELRAVVRYAVACAEPVLEIFERARPGDPRPRAAIDVAQAFAEGAERTKVLRDRAWAAHRAAQEARDAGHSAASDAARAAANACGAAFLHPLPKATQIKHILGSAAYAASAFELSNGAGDITRYLAPTIVVDVLKRYPLGPNGGGRVGEWMRRLDTLLRNHTTSTS